MIVEFDVREVGGWELGTVDLEELGYTEEKFKKLESHRQRDIIENYLNKINDGEMYEVDRVFGIN